MYAAVSKASSRTMILKVACPRNPGHQSVKRSLKIHNFQPIHKMYRPNLCRYRPKCILIEISNHRQHLVKRVYIFLIGLKLVPVWHSPRIHSR